MNPSFFRPNPPPSLIPSPPPPPPTLRPSISFVFSEEPDEFKILELVVANAMAYTEEPSTKKSKRKSVAAPKQQQQPAQPSEPPRNIAEMKKHKALMNKTQVSAGPPPLDIVCGKGNKKQAGNRLFLRLVGDNQHAYQQQSDRTLKSILVDSIIQTMHNQGSRFIVLDKATNTWVEASNAVARTKTRDALRARSKRGEQGHAKAAIAAMAAARNASTPTKKPQVKQQRESAEDAPQPQGPATPSSAVLPSGTTTTLPPPLSPAVSSVQYMECLDSMPMLPPLSPVTSLSCHFDDYNTPPLMNAPAVEWSLPPKRVSYQTGET